MRELSVRATLVRLIVFIAVVAVLLVIVVQAIQRPIAGDTMNLRAVFTDASGLKTGDDIRMYGVAVGKVSKIALEKDQAEVTFSVRRSRPVYDTSVIAIRYQSLTGQRYVDIQQPAQPGQRLSAGSVIAAQHTIPSFDITQLFNGLEPILTEVSPGAVNKFATSVLAVIQGDGSGIGAALNSIEQISNYVSDRQAVISTIVRNLGDISGRIGGKSPYLVTLLHGITQVFVVLQEKLDGLINFAEMAPSALGPLNSLMATLGFTQTSNPDLLRLFPDPKTAVDALSKLPALLQALAAAIPSVPSQDHLNLTCSKGQAAVPGVVQVLIAGQRIAICNS